MKKIIFLLLLMTAVIFGQKWVTYSSVAHNISFKHPETWKVTLSETDGIPMIETVSNDSLMYMLILIFKEAKITPQDLFSSWVTELGVTVNGTPQTGELNGMNAVMAAATGNSGGIDFVYHITAATGKTQSYLCYMFTPVESVEQYSDVMGEIVDSLKPVQ